jgi:hypothetical protein
MLTCISCSICPRLHNLIPGRLDSILGGIGTVLEWWPIKAYRPCPNFVDRGGKYVRSGQGSFHFLVTYFLCSQLLPGNLSDFMRSLLPCKGLDEIAFGRIQND